MRPKKKSRSSITITLLISKDWLCMEPYVKRLRGAVFRDLFDDMDFEANGGVEEAVVA